MDPGPARPSYRAALKTRYRHRQWGGQRPLSDMIGHRRTTLAQAVRQAGRWFLSPGRSVRPARPTAAAPPGGADAMARRGFLGAIRVTSGVLLQGLKTIGSRSPRSARSIVLSLGGACWRIQSSDWEAASRGRTGKTSKRSTSMPGSDLAHSTGPRTRRVPRGGASGRGRRRQGGVPSRRRAGHLSAADRRWATRAAQPRNRWSCRGSDSLIEGSAERARIDGGVPVELRLDRLE